MKKYVLIFHHTDLDGMGVKFLGILYAQSKGLPYKTFCCGYYTINESILKALENTDEIAEIIIGDISCNVEVAKKLDKLYKAGLSIRLRDHHETASHLNKFEWAFVSEKCDNDEFRCGTWWLGQDIDMLPFYERNKALIDTIDAWDTWKWKSTNNMDAKNFNALMGIMGEEMFTEYCLSIDGKANRPSDLFNAETSVMVKTFNLFIAKQVKTCEKYMYTMNLWVYDKRTDKKHPYKFKCGVIFCNMNLSEVGDGMLDAHPEIDVLMIMVLPGSISWRTQKNLPVPLGRIAKLATGSGGGHPQASGSTLTFNQFKELLTEFMDKNFSAELDYSDLRSIHEKR